MFCFFSKNYFSSFIFLKTKSVYVLIFSVSFISNYQISKLSGISSIKYFQNLSTRTSARLSNFQSTMFTYFHKQFYKKPSNFDMSSSSIPLDILLLKFYFSFCPNFTFCFISIDIYFSLSSLFLSVNKSTKYLPLFTFSVIYCFSLDQSDVEDSSIMQLFSQQSLSKISILYRNSSTNPPAPCFIKYEHIIIMFRSRFNFLVLVISTFLISTFNSNISRMRQKESELQVMDASSFSLLVGSIQLWYFYKTLIRLYQTVYLYYSLSVNIAFLEALQTFLTVLVKYENMQNQYYQKSFQISSNIKIMENNLSKFSRPGQLLVRFPKMNNCCALSIKIIRFPISIFRLTLEKFRISNLSYLCT